jgi:hypothetical protein
VLPFFLGLPLIATTLIVIGAPVRPMDSGLKTVPLLID